MDDIHIEGNYSVFDKREYTPDSCPRSLSEVEKDIFWVVTNSEKSFRDREKEIQASFEQEIDSYGRQQLTIILLFTISCIVFIALSSFFTLPRFFAMYNNLGEGLKAWIFIEDSCRQDTLDNISGFRKFVIELKKFERRVGLQRRANVTMPMKNLEEEEEKEITVPRSFMDINMKEERGNYGGPFKNQDLTLGASEKRPPKFNTDEESPEQVVSSSEEEDDDEVA